jgi:hypothetical protein
MMQPFDDEGHAEFYGDPIDPGDSRQIERGQAVIDSCPEQAPSWRDTGAD